MAQREAIQSLIDLTKSVGVPETLMTDESSEFISRSTEFVKHSRRIRM